MIVGEKTLKRIEQDRKYVVKIILEDRMLEMIKDYAAMAVELHVRVIAGAGDDTLLNNRIKTADATGKADIEVANLTKLRLDRETKNAINDAIVKIGIVWVSSQ